MADKIKIASVESANVEHADELGREYSEKLQQLGRGLVSSLYMLIRSVKLYDPENAIFQKPLGNLVDTVNTIIAKEGKLELQGVQDSVYLNGMLVKVDVGSLDNVKDLLAELRAKDVGGISLSRPTHAGDMKSFIWIFAKEQQEAPSEEGVAGRKLLNMRLTRWSKLKERLDKDDSGNVEEQKVDRKKYAMTVYARAVIYVQKYLEALHGSGEVLPTGKAARVIQDMVDVSFEQRSHFLGMSTLRADDDYLAYHHANCALMSIVFGGELGLDKAHLRELGTAALFHDVGLAMIPRELLTKRGALTKEEKAQVQKAPLLAVRSILREKGMSRGVLNRLVVTHEHKAEFGSAVRDSRGNIQMIVPKGHLSVFSKIVSICCTYDALTSKRPYRDPYGPQIALMLMWTEMRHRFDPELLKVFMNVMAIQPIKVLSKKQRTISMA